MKNLIVALAIVALTWGVAFCGIGEEVVGGYFSVYQEISVDNNHPPSGYQVWTTVWENKGGPGNIVWCRMDNHVNLKNIEQVKKQAIDEAMIARGMMYKHHEQAKKALKEAGE